MSPPLVFLSHSGADAEAARELKRRLMDAPDARAAGLKVWLDKDTLRPGTPWLAQIAEAIQDQATAFVVYVGSGGVMNWVEAEVDLALSRATTSKPNPLLFIPALDEKSGGSNALPPFAKRYQGVRDPLGNGEELGKLLKAVLGIEWDASVGLIEEPFVGLRAMREEEADRFFGRDAEIKELVEKFRKRRIVAIVADSGTGKSSLAAAGFAPAFRGGALADTARSEPDDRVWHVVTMRPGSSPEEGLRTGVSEAAEKLGRSGDERAGLRKRIALNDPSETAFALQCDLPTKKTATLLIVDQFEELFTATPEAAVAPFLTLLVALADGDKDIRVLLTVRADYFNLLSGVGEAAADSAARADGESLFQRLNRNAGEAILRLKRISEEGLRDVVCRPLRLAGETDEAPQAAMAKAVQRDLSDQPSDLPLLQVALRAVWQEHRSAGLALLEAYESVGGVLGALAREAEKARSRLASDDQARLESIFVRLVRLGDTGGATRRTAALDEFDAPRRRLLQRLGGDDCGRLVVVGEKSAEIAHEALITQWPWLQGRLKESAQDVRRLARLIDKTTEWRQAPPTRQASYLASGAEREVFDDLAARRADWLSRDDRDFVAESDRTYRADIDAKRAEAEARQRDRELEQERRIADAEKLALAEQRTAQRTRIGLFAALALLLVALGLAGAALNEGYRAQRMAGVAETEARNANGEKEKADQAADEAVRQRGQAIRNEAVALTALANVEASMRPVNAAKLAVASWPRDARDATTPRLPGTLIALGRTVPDLRERRIIRNAGGFACFSPDGSRLVTARLDAAARIWDAATGSLIALLGDHIDGVISAAFSPDGARIVTASSDGTARLWDAGSGAEIAALRGHSKAVYSAAFSPDGKRIVTASGDKTARVWNVASATQLLTLTGHAGEITSAAFSPDGTRLVTASLDGVSIIWDANSGQQLLAFKGHASGIISAAFSPNGRLVVTSSFDETARVWNAESGQEIHALKAYSGVVWSAAFSRDGLRIVTGSADGVARMWDVATGDEVASFRGHPGAVVSVDFSPDGAMVVTGDTDKAVRFWDAETGREIGELRGHEGPLFSVAISPDGKHIAISDKFNVVRIFDAALGPPALGRLGQESASLIPFVSRGQSDFVDLLSDKIAGLLDRSTEKVVATLTGHDGPITSIAFSRDGTRIVTGSADKTARIWDADLGRELVAVRGHQGPVWSAQLSSDGSRVVTGSTDGTARIWDASSGGEITKIEGQPGTVWSAAFSPDGTRIVTASDDSTARVWDAATGAPVLALHGHQSIIRSVSFSPDGAQILTASSDKTARIWDAASGRPLATLVGHEGRIFYAAFNSDGTRIVTASEDKTSRVWDAATGMPIAILKGHAGTIWSAAFSPDATRVVTASADETARVWDLSTIAKGNILEVACALLRMHENPVSLEGVTDYPLTFDRPICVTDPPPPDPLGAAAAKTPR